MTRCETPLEREQRELREASESSRVLGYRTFKILLRSTPNRLNPDGDERSKKIAALTEHILAQLERVPTEQEGSPPGPPPKPLTPLEYVEVAREIYELRHLVRETDEDRYPTILHVLYANDETTSASLAWYGSTHEHMALSLAWLALKQVPREFRVYETGKIAPQHIEHPPLRLGAHLIRGATFLTEDWPLMCEVEMDDYLDLLSRSRKDFTPMGAALVAHTASADATGPSSTDASVDLEQAFASLHAPGVLVRGLCRLRAEKEDPALDDLDAFLVDADRLGVQSEVVWLVGAYVALKREQKERAVSHLRRLAESSLFDEPTRELFREAAEAVEEREPESALNTVTDKVVLATVVGTYVVRQLGRVDWQRELEKTEGGQRLMRLGQVLVEEEQRVRDAMSPEQLSTWGDKARGVVGRDWTRDGQSALRRLRVWWSEDGEAAE